MTTEVIWEACRRCGHEYDADGPGLCSRHRLCALCHEADGITPKP